MNVSKENKVFDKVVITLDSQQEVDILWDFIEEYYHQYEVGSLERDFLIELSKGFSSL